MRHDSIHAIEIESVQRCLHSVLRHCEYGAVIMGATRGRGPVKNILLADHDAGIGIAPVGSAAEVVEHSFTTAGRNLEHRAAIAHSTNAGGAVKIAGLVENHAP